jgi:hypothetical protein
VTGQSSPAPDGDRVHAAAALAAYQARPQPAQLPHPNPVAEIIIQAFNEKLTVDGKNGHLDYVLAFVCKHDPDLAVALLDAIESGARP